MKKTFLLLISGYVLMSGCREKPLPEEVFGTPDFFISAEIAGEPVEIKAGIDDYYMETGYSKDQFDIYSFHGNFTRLHCPQCPGELEIIIRDDFSPGNYAYYQEKGANKQIYRVSFTNQSSGQGSEPAYNWNFGDGTTFIGENPVHDYTDTTLTTTHVCLETLDPSGCTTTICNEIDFTAPGCQADFTHELDENISYVTFFAKASGKAPFKYRWDFGDGFNATLGNPGYFYSTPGLYTVCLTVTDAEGCEAKLCKNVAADPDFCEHNFTYIVEKTTTPEPVQPSTVTINWRNREGKKFSSAEEEQPLESYFEILEEEPYRNNEKGEKVRRLKVRFSCELFRDGEKITLPQAEGWIGVAYPG
ncbi:MAG: PKD domain-containing protein [Bacteroidia bacterium]|nr:PKD domain-containing protein [Bacteroidia bacterium]